MDEFIRYTYLFADFKLTNKPRFEMTTIVVPIAIVS